RLAQFARKSGDLLLEIGRRCFASLGLRPLALALHQLSASTASLHVPPRAVHDNTQSYASLAFAPWQGDWMTNGMSALGQERTLGSSAASVHRDSRTSHTI